MNKKCIGGVRQPGRQTCVGCYQGHRGEKWEKVGSWTQREKRGRVSRVLSASLPILAQEDP
eukprot:6143387-Pyramimonas_sp.AAC.1